MRLARLIIINLQLKPMKRAAFALLFLACTASRGWAAGVDLKIGDGKISIDAQDVTIRQILSEWARLGHTQIVNLERVASGPISLKLEGVPEKEALDVILRAVPGYVAAPRASYIPGASIYDRILILATATTVQPVAARPQAPTFPSPMSPNVTQFRAGQPFLTPGTPPDAPADADPQDDPAIAAAAAAGLVTVPALMPGPTMLNPNQPLMPPGASQTPAQPAPGAAVPANPWNAPAGASRPGLAPPPPPAPTPPISPFIRPRPPQADR
jgi:hypothetical protein